MRNVLGRLNSILKTKTKSQQQKGYLYIHISITFQLSEIRIKYLLIQNKYKFLINDSAYHQYKCIE